MSKQKEDSKTQENFTIDYRNCKYYGQIIQSELGKIPHGFGIVLDQNYTWVATTWNSAKIIASPTAAIFADSDKIYTNQGVDFNSLFNFNFIVYEGDGFRLCKFAEHLVVDIRDHIEIEPQYHQTFSKFKIIEQKKKIRRERNYSDELELIDHKQYNEFNQQQISKQMMHNNNSSIQLDFQKWLRFNFASQLSIFPNSHTQSHANRKRKIHDLSIQLNNQSTRMGVNFTNKGRCQIAKVGYKNEFEQIYKKCNYYAQGEGYLAQEHIAGDLQSYTQYEILTHNRQTLDFGNSYQKQQKQTNDYFGRSNINVHRQCTKNLQQYYKRSLKFSNKYLNISCVYSLRQQFKKVLKACLTLLRQQEIRAHQNRLSILSYIKQKDKSLEEEQNQNYIYEASIDDIKKEIIRTQQMGKSKSRISKLKRSNIEEYERGGASPDKQKQKVKNWAARSQKQGNENMFKTSQNGLIERLLKNQKQKSDMRESSISKYEYYFEDENVQPQKYKTPKSQIYKQENNYNYMQTQKQQQQQQQQQFPYRIRNLQQSIFNPLASKQQIKNLEESDRLDRQLDNARHNYQNYPTSSTSYRSRPELQMLTLNYEDIEDEIEQYENEKKNMKKMGGGKGTSTKNTTPRRKKIVEHNSKSNTNNGKMKSVGRERSESRSPYNQRSGSNTPTKPSKIAQAFKKVNKQNPKSRYLKI